MQIKFQPIFRQFSNCWKRRKLKLTKTFANILGKGYEGFQNAFVFEWTHFADLLVAF